jgi:hypothetical protein
MEILWARKLSRSPTAEVFKTLEIFVDQEIRPMGANQHGT